MCSPTISEGRQPSTDFTDGDTQLSTPSVLANTTSLEYSASIL